MALQDVELGVLQSATAALPEQLAEALPNLLLPALAGMLQTATAAALQTATAALPSMLAGMLPVEAPVRTHAAEVRPSPGAARCSPMAAPSGAPGLALPINGLDPEGCWCLDRRPRRGG
jgi:hypothetical protein